jgi:hypothetical protein
MYDQTYKMVRAQADAMPQALAHAATVLQHILEVYRGGERSAGSRFS